MGALTEPWVLGRRDVPSRVVFGPHETNLGAGRSIGGRHVAYYAARAAGGTGVLVTETASVHPSDWPYERAPLASACGPGWHAVVEACRPYGTVVLAGLGHAGGQGSSAYSQHVLWAPSPVADAVSREMPMEMGAAELAATVDGFARAARAAVAAGMDGVEVDAGAWSLLRQFHSGLTNVRRDAYGEDRLQLTREVLASIRQSIGPDAVLALRLCCDELAPWAGVTPEHAADHVADLSDRVDLLTVVRGGPYSSTAYRPDAHTPAGFNHDLCAAMRQAAAGRVPVVLQGSVVDPDEAERALGDGTADLVEMTRAQIADPRLVALVGSGDAGRTRPCILCNQACQVRDNRNPIVSCIGEPRSGYETTDLDPAEVAGGPYPTALHPTPLHPTAVPPVLVVGAGVAGLECARVLRLHGRAVRIAERSPRSGGALRAAAVGAGREHLAALADWLESECVHLGTEFEFGHEMDTADLDAARTDGTVVVLATGGRPAPFVPPSDGSVVVVDAASALLAGPGSAADGPVVVHDPVGGPIAVGVAEWVAATGRAVSIVSPDPVAGTLLARTGDLADANGRLQRAGVHRELRARLRRIAAGAAELEDIWTGEVRAVPCTLVVDGGHRLPDDTLCLRRPDVLRAGDCVAPRTALEAVLEGRRRALEICGLRDAAGVPTVGAVA